MNFRIELEYDGTRYSGWQKQKNSRTIQGTILDCITNIFDKTNGENILIDFQGSGRTDAGVHALNQIAHLKCKTSLSPGILMLKLNDCLPADINVLRIKKVNENFHSRHNAVSRQYFYQISKRRNALEKKFIWWIKDDLDYNKMENASKLFLGFKDFASFSDVAKNESSTVLVENIYLEETEDKILIRIKASHYLWKMVRRIVGVLVEAGRNKLNENEINLFFKSYSEYPREHTAPPSGLFLEKVFY
jgi:tRNA pseudouridine38-40 synthase